MLIASSRVQDSGPRAVVGALSPAEESEEESGYYY
jgi:hypothetical protein